MTEPFSYNNAFSRNIGWVSFEEQALLRGNRVAIAGMGGVGGSHLLTLARLDIGAFNIADFDAFDIANINRQLGATVPNIGKPKVEVLAAMALEINPELDIKVFPQGADGANLPDFLMGSTCMSTAWTFLPLPRARLPSQPARAPAYQPSRQRRSAWGLRCSTFSPGR